PGPRPPPDPVEIRRRPTHCAASQRRLDGLHAESGVWHRSVSVRPDRWPRRAAGAGAALATVADVWRQERADLALRFGRPRNLRRARRWNPHAVLRAGLTDVLSRLVGPAHRSGERRRRALHRCNDRIHPGPQRRLLALPKAGTPLISQSRCIAPRTWP